MTAAPTQLVLRFPRTPGDARDLLPNPAQDEARAWLARAPTWPLCRLALYGESGSGKSHLAAAWAHANGGQVLSAPPAEWPGTPIALDSIDTVPDEPALLHMLNAALESRRPVLLLSRTAPGRLPVRLPDLASRLRATTAVRLAPPGDEFLAQLLARLLADQQLRLPTPVQSWLLARLPRTPAALQDAVSRLEAASLQSHRTITRPMAAEVLGLTPPDPTD